MKQAIATNPFPQSIFYLKKKHKLHRIKDLYKAPYEISMISLKYNRIKSYYQKSAMKKRKGEIECRFVRRKNYVKHSVLIRSGRKCFEF